MSEGIPRPKRFDGFLTTKDVAGRSGLTVKQVHDNRKRLGGRVHQDKRGHRHAYYPPDKFEAFIEERQAIGERPADPDLIFTEEAEDLTKCCRQTLHRIVKAEDLFMGEVQVLDSIGKVHTRTVFRRSELSATFISQPDPGEPIRVGPKETYYLRRDAKRRFGFSDMVLEYWEDKPSRLRHGKKALRKRHFYVIVGRALGSPKRLTAWRGEDIDRILAGDEGTKPFHGRSFSGKEQRQAERDRAEAVLLAMMPHLPQLASDAIAHAQKQGLSLFLIHQTRNRLGIKTDYRHEGKRRVYYWLKPGQQVLDPGRKLGAIPQPTSAQGDQASASVGTPTSSSEGKRKRGKRGRKPGQRNPEVVERERLMLEAWDRGEFGTNKAAAGRAFCFNRPDASRVITAHEKSKA